MSEEVFGRETAVDLRKEFLLTYGRAYRNRDGYDTLHRSTIACREPYRLCLEQT